MHTLLPRPARIAVLLIALAAPWAPGAWAQPRPAASATALVVDSVEVNADAGLSPGSTLDFTVRGTPAGQARVQLAGSTAVVPLREGAPGVYTGRHTIARSDRIDATQPIQASLRADGRMTISKFDFPPAFQSLRPSAPAPVVTARIDSFGADPVVSLEPGAQLRFVVDGTPGAAATVSVPGIADALPLQEARPGHYVGRYTLRLEDRLLPGPVTATLRSADTWSTARLGGSLGPAAPQGTTLGAAAPVASMPVALEVLSPVGGTVVDSSQVVVRGRTSPNARVHAQVHAIAPTARGMAAVAVPVMEQTVQADANGDFSINLGPQRVPAGARLEMDLAASLGNAPPATQRFVLFQRQG